ncbi:S-layer homology domain-containing protein [Paenibacillus kandeliae]|uniref:S-layer homology domain-containing protein n=1 Tax=Paenibacillus kandeliae TaxID=3231269 RepID=UPI00345768F9
MKKWMILCLAALIALPGTAVTSVYADDNTSSTTTSNTSNNETSSNNSTVTSNTYSTEESSTSTENSTTSTSGGGGGTATTNATTNKPVISLIDDASVRMKVGTSFVDSGTTVQDDVYNDLTAKVTYTLNSQSVDAIDTNTVGTYVIHYNVTTPDDRIADEVTRTVNIVAVGDYVDLSTISIPSAYGMAQYGDYVYVAQRQTGLARVNLYSGKVETIVSSGSSFMAVALNTDGDLFYTVDSDRNIYKVSHTDLQNLPLSESSFNAKKTVYYYAANYNYIYGLAIDAQNNMYFSDYTTKSILKLPQGSTTPEVVLSNFTTYFASFTIDPLGNLYMSGGGDYKLYRINATTLNSLPVSSSNVTDISNNNYYGAYGMFFTPDGSFYVGAKFKKNQENSVSVKAQLSLNGKAEMSVYQGETFVDPGASVVPDIVTPTVTYMFNGSPTPSIDTNVVGTYTIHYAIPATSQYDAQEVTRTLTVQAVPSELTKVQMNRPFGLAYYNGDVYYTDYDRGIYKVSTTTFKTVKLFDSYQIVAIALNKQGDLFYTKVSDNTIYKLSSKYVRYSAEGTLNKSDFEEYSRQYYTVPVDESTNDGISINGLAFDSQDRLYFNAVSQNEMEISGSKIWRLPANSTDNVELVATYPVSTLGMTISPYGNLYINVNGRNGFELYEADAALLNNVPVSTNQFRALGNTNYAYGIMFLPDLTGYTSSVQPAQNLTKLNFLDKDYSIPEVQDIPVSNVSLDQNTLNLKKNGSSQTLTVNIMPDNATHTELVWKTSNPQVATVKDGVVTPVGKGTATILVYVANQQDMFAEVNVTVKDSDKTSSSSSNDLKLSVDDGKGKNTVPSTASVSRSVQSNGQMQDQITFDSAAMLQAINTLKSAAQQTVRLVVPDAADQVAQTDVTLPLNVSQDLKNTDMNLEISTNDVKLSVAPSSLKNVNNDLYFHFIPLKTTAQQNAVAARAKQEQIVKDALGNGSISVVGRPMTIETNLQNQPVQLVMPVDNSVIPTNAADREQWLQQLRIFIEHSDGDRELVQPTVVSYGTNETGLQFTVNKFSTFTIVDMDKLNASNTSNSTTTGNTNSDNGTSGTVKPAYIQGYPDHTFRPDQGITRAEMASLLYRLQASGGTGTAGTVNYSDVSSSFWAKQAIDVMQSSGLMKGRTSTTFAPAQLITRAEMAAIVSRWQGLSGTGSSFASDINGNWAETDIKRVVTAGLMQGITPASFQPNQPLTRAQAVTILNKILEKTANLSAGTTSWKDVPSSHWAYSDIMEASNSYSLK